MDNYLSNKLEEYEFELQAILDKIRVQAFSTGFVNELEEQVEWKRSLIWQVLDGEDMENASFPFRIGWRLRISKTLEQCYMKLRETATPKPSTSTSSLVIPTNNERVKAKKNRKRRRVGTEEEELELLKKGLKPVRGRDKRHFTLETDMELPPELKTYLEEKISSRRFYYPSENLLKEWVSVWHDENLSYSGELDLINETVNEVMGCILREGNK